MVLYSSLTEDAGRRGFSFCNQRGGYTETHTNRAANLRSAGRRSHELFSNSSGFTTKAQKSVFIYTDGNKFIGKTKHFRTFGCSQTTISYWLGLLPEKHSRVIFAKSSPMFFLSRNPRQKNPSKDSLNENIYNRYLQ